jgi:hypothetical protein
MSCCWAAFRNFGGNPLFGREGNHSAFSQSWFSLLFLPVAPLHSTGLSFLPFASSIFWYSFTAALASPHSASSIIRLSANRLFFFAIFSNHD